MSFSNLLIDDLISESKSALNIYQNSHITIDTSKFTHVSTLRKGSVISLEKDSNAIIQNSVLANNSSPFGGVASVFDSNAWLLLDNCDINNNFALESGVIAADLEGSFEIKHSWLQNNYAYSNPLFKIFISTKESIISNSTIDSNELLEKEDIYKESLHC